MHTFLRAMRVGAMGAVVTPAFTADEPTADPVIGTSNLNLARSKFSPGPAPKRQVRTYAETPQGLSKGTGAKGQYDNVYVFDRQ